MLELSHINKQYNSGPLLQDVSFTVQQDETVCLLGPSGAGKSTILRIIAGLERPAAGEVLWNGENILNLPPHQRKFGLMFQDYALFPHLNVYENVAFGLRVSGVSERKIVERVSEALEMASLQHLAGRSVTDLSGGEKQRVAFARAIAPKPKLLMLDEPMGSLDRTLRDQLLAELYELLKVADIPVIYVTHDQEEAFSIADRILILHEAKIFQTGSPREIYAHPESLWVASFFGFTNQLNGKVLSLNPFIINTEIGRVAVLCGLDGFSIGDALDVVIPPAAIKINARKDGKNIFMGKIIESNFHGMNYRIKIKMQNSIIFTFESNSELLVGEPLKFSIDPSAVLCFLRNP
ncbi:MAG: ABC transporter ATP-binding protein [Anaerolineaceae bacterium]|nr:ABC transporter ATP-binding protein [Anaerolineaceae bacterium]